MRRLVIVRCGGRLMDVGRVIFCPRATAYNQAQENGRERDSKNRPVSSRMIINESVSQVTLLGLCKSKSSAAITRRG